MINAYLEQFLDTGWFNCATLYYKGYTYWCEANSIPSNEQSFHFFVYRYRSVLHNDDDDIWTSRMVENHDVVDYSVVMDIYTNDELAAKEIFLNAKIFEGKSFWEVESEIAWYDEY